MLLRQTRARLAHAAKETVFRLGNFQSVVDERELQLLTSHMGFRHQWDEHRRFQFDFIRAQGLRPGQRVLEIGCGPLTLGVPLMNYLEAGGYTGLDVRPEVLDIAHRQLAKEGLSVKRPRLLLSESFGADELGEHETFDVVWSFSVLYHLTDELVDACFRQVARRLAPGGAYCANVNAEMPESTWLQFPFNRRDPSFYGAVAGRCGLAMAELGSLESLGFALPSDEKRNRLLRFTRRPAQ